MAIRSDYSIGWSVSDFSYCRMPIPKSTNMHPAICQASSRCPNQKYAIIPAAGSSNILTIPTRVEFIRRKEPSTSEISIVQFFAREQDKPYR